MAAAVTKSVLVSYLDRNKVIRIPHGKPSGLDDLQFFESELKTWFSFQKNVRLCVMFQSSLDTPLPLNRDRKGLGTQVVKMSTFMPRNRHPNQIARATCSFVLSHDLTWCQREEKGLLTQNC